MCAEVTYSGGCLCGGFKYTNTGERFQLTNCHCNKCHKATGAALYTTFVIPRSCVKTHNVINVAKCNTYA